MQPDYSPTIGGLIDEGLHFSEIARRVGRERQVIRSFIAHRPELRARYEAAQAVRIRDDHFASWRRRYPGKRTETLIQFLTEAEPAGFDIAWSHRPWLTTVCGARIQVHHVGRFVTVGHYEYLRLSFLRPERFHVVRDPTGTWVFVLPSDDRPRRYLYCSPEDLADGRLWPTPSELTALVEQVEAAATGPTWRAPHMSWQHP